VPSSPENRPTPSAAVEPRAQPVATDAEGQRDDGPGRETSAPVAAGVVESPPIRRVLRPFREFARVEAAGGLVLLACTVIALAGANSPWSASYEALWHARLTVGVEGVSLSKDLRHWVNDGLMALFFFVVGLEIKREVLVGELADRWRPTSPSRSACWRWLGGERRWH
jgi:hypothetical protein